MTTKINVMVIRYFPAFPETNNCILRAIRHLAEKTQAILREISHGLGTMVATYPDTLPALLRHSNLKRTKPFYLSNDLPLMTLFPPIEDD